MQALPEFLQILVGRLVAAGVYAPEAAPNHCLINEYTGGSGIPAHDDGPLYIPPVATISLGGDAVINFVTPASPGAQAQLISKASSLSPCSCSEHSRRYTLMQRELDRHALEYCRICSNSAWTSGACRCLLGFYWGSLLVSVSPGPFSNCILTAPKVLAGLASACSASFPWSAEQEGQEIQNSVCPTEATGTLVPPKAGSCLWKLLLVGWFKLDHMCRKGKTGTNVDAEWVLGCFVMESRIRIAFVKNEQ